MRPIVRALLSLAALAAAPAAADAPSIADAWIRATPPGARTAAAYMTLNGAATADRLLGAATPAAEAVELHTNVVENGATRMERLPVLAVPAGASVRLEPGGAHLMLIGLASTLAPGTKVALELQFESAGTVELEVPVVDARANAHAH